MAKCTKCRIDEDQIAEARIAEERIWADIQADEKELLEDKIDEERIGYED